MEHEHELLKTAEVASLCRVTPKTVWSWHKTGKLVGIELPGRELRFRREDVAALLSPTEPDKAAS